MNDNKRGSILDDYITVVDPPEQKTASKSGNNNPNYTSNRDVNHSLMMLVHVGKSIYCLPYNYLTLAEFNLEQGLRIKFTEIEFIIQGKNLYSLLELIQRHKLSSIRVNRSKYDLEEQNAIYIDNIEVVEV